MDELLLRGGSFVCAIYVDVIGRCDVRWYDGWMWLGMRKKAVLEERVAVRAKNDDDEEEI